METSLRLVPPSGNPARLAARDLPVNAAQPPGWQRTQCAAILGLAAAGAELERTGLDRAEAVRLSTLAVRSFLQQLVLDDRNALATVGTVQQTVEDFLQNDGRLAS